MSIDEERVEFWTAYQPGFRFTSEEPGTADFYRAVERHRYSLEPHILDVARFADWAGKDVLDVGCGIATDGVQFARAGALYTGFDGSPAAIALAERRFQLEGLPADLRSGDATRIPFRDNSFDLVWSHGVIHHFPNTHEAVAEFRRVLRPGGTCLVMLYHRASFNYYVTIMLVRRMLAATLLVPGAANLIARMTGEDPAVMAGHKALLAEYGIRYLTDRELFLSNNTDGPGNPLSKVYSASSAQDQFAGWKSVDTTVRFLNLRAYPNGDRLGYTRLPQRLVSRWC